MSLITLPEGYTPPPFFVSGARQKLGGHVFHAICADIEGRQETIALVFYDPKQHGICWADARLLALAPQMATEVIRLRAEVVRLTAALGAALTGDPA